MYGNVLKQGMKIYLYSYDMCDKLIFHNFRGMPKLFKGRKLNVANIAFDIIPGRC